MSRAAFASDTRNASSSLEGTATADAKGGTEGGASGGADGAASGGASTVTISRALEHCGTRHLPPQQQRLARAAPVNSRHPARIERIVHFLQFHHHLYKTMVLQEGEPEIEAWERRRGR